MRALAVAAYALGIVLAVAALAFALALWVLGVRFETVNQD